MALDKDYEVNEKLLELLRDGSKGNKLIPVINSAFASAADPILIKLIIDLRALTPLLDEWKKDAVQSILAVDWAAKSDEVVREHSQLLVSIAAAHACHLEGVLKFFVKKFLGNPPTSQDLKEHDEKMSKINERSWNEAHKAFALILEIMPTSSRLLIKILRETYPYMKRHVVHLRNYSRNLLTITSYAPNLRVDILRIVIDELIKLDTTCSHEALEAAANDSGASSSDGEVFQMEPELARSQSSHIKEIIDMRTKLDVCIYDVFKYLSSLRDAEEEEKVSSFYNDLLTIFESSVLPVFSSHHVQFLWFVFCSYDKKFWKHFVNWLWHHVQTPSVVSSIRQNAASYLASYVARAMYLDVDVLTACVQAWVHWIHAYIGNQEGAGARDNASVHSTFYSVCQAVFYVVAFRVKEILALRNGYDFLKSLSLDRVVTCRLNPLKYCSEKVVTNFANVGRNYQFVFCWTVLERNRRSSFLEQRRTGIAPNQLVECFFPFDPYLLPKSVEFVTPLYREYDEGNLEEETSHIAVTSKNGDQDDENDFLDDELMDTSPRPAVGSLGMMSPTARGHTDMWSYSVSPGFKHG